MTTQLFTWKTALSLNTWAKFASLKLLLGSFSMSLDDDALLDDWCSVNDTFNKLMTNHTNWCTWCSLCCDSWGKRETCLRKVWSTIYTKHFLQWLWHTMHDPTHVVRANRGWTKSFDTGRSQWANGPWLTPLEAFLTQQVFDRHAR